MDTTVTIIGAGPLGLELGIVLKRAAVPCLIFDKGQVAQMIYQYSPQTHFFSSNERIGIAGFPIQTLDQQKCSREQYLAYIRSLVMHSQLKVNTFEEVVDIVPQHSHFVIHTKRKGKHYQYRTQFVVVATGGISTPRLLEIPGEDLPHVHTKLEDPHLYFGQRLTIIGGKNSAVEGALRAFQVGASVTLVDRHESLDEGEIKYWLLPELKGRIKRQEIQYYPKSVPQSIDFEHVTIQTDCGDIIKIPSDFVVKSIGFIADLNLLKILKIPLLGPKEKPLYNWDTMETEIENVFVLGTVVGGTQTKYQAFIENCHDHVNKIARTIFGRLGLTIDIKVTHFNQVLSSPEE